MSIWESISDPKERLRKKDLGLKIGTCLEKINDAKSALELYKALLGQWPLDKEVTKRIDALEKKMGTNRPGAKKPGQGGKPAGGGG